MIDLMDRLGIVASAIEMGTVKLDGLCSWSASGRPHILLATDKMSFPRRQTDAAHELAHALLHGNVGSEELKSNLKFIETQAFRLASAFLLPASSYPVEIQSISLASLLVSKERWRVSVKAQIKRLSDLDIISGEFATHLYKLYSAKRWSREEPLDKQWTPAEPRVLRDALHLIVDERVRSKADLLALKFAISAGDIENLAGLSPGWFSREPAQILNLNPRNVAHTIFEGEVIPFVRPRSR